MKKFFTLILLVTQLFVTTLAQTDQKNLDKYWAYRERLKKNFLKIGVLPGESIPISARSIGFAYSGAPLIDGNAPSRIYHTDATIYLGHYLWVLATEYKAFEMNGQDTQPTLNELYYAIAALNRLDLNAEMYLTHGTNALSPDDANGLLMRDDTPLDFYTHFENDYSQIFERNANIIRTHSDFDPLFIWSNDPYPGDNASQHPEINQGANENGVNRGNIMSLDHITTLFSGLRCVYDLVPSIIVQPTSIDPAVNLLEEARNIANRIISQCVTVTENNTRFDFRIYRPDGTPVKADNGGDLSFAAPFIMDLADHFNHPDFPNGATPLMMAIGEVPVILRADELKQMVEDFEIVFGEDIGANFTIDWLPCMNNLINHLDDLGTEPVTVATIPYHVIDFLVKELQDQNFDFHNENDLNACLQLNPDIINALQEIQVNIEGFNCDNILKIVVKIIGNIINGTLVGGILSMTFKALDLVLEGLELFGIDVGPTVCLADNIDPEKGPILHDDNVHILLELGTITDVWSIDYLHSIAVNSNMSHYTLLNDILNNIQASFTNDIKVQVENAVLNTAPCIGPSGNPTIEVDSGPENWMSQNRLFHPNNSIVGIDDNSFRGEYSGLDYMFFLNAAQILWAPELPEYEREISCNCVEEITFESLMTIVLQVTRKFPDYKAKGIPIESYLAHSLDVSTASGAVDVRNDLIICRENADVETVFTIKDGATLNLYNGNKILVKAGNKLIIENGAHIEVGISEANPQDPNSYPEPEIILEENAELRIIGSDFYSLAGCKITLAEGAKFIVENSSITLSAASDQSGIYSQGGEWIMTNSTFNNNYSLDNYSIFENGSHITFTDCPNVNFGRMNLQLNNQSHLTSNNSNIYFNHADISTLNTVILGFTDSELHLNASQIRTLSTSIISQTNSDFNITNGGYIQMYEGTEVANQSKYSYNSGNIILAGSDSHMVFEGAQLHIAAGATFAPTHPNAQSGYIQFRGIDDAELVTGYQSKLKLVGDGPTDVMLVINDWAELQNANYKMGSIELENCAVDLTNNGRLWTDMNLKGTNVNFVDNSTNTTNQTAGGEVQVWYATTCFLENCNFNQVRLHSRYTYTVGTGTSFSGIRSGFRAMDGRYKLDLCSFDACHLESNSLHNASYIRKCNFNSPAYIGNGFIQPACVYDESLVELYVSETNFTNARQALVKQGGRLSVRCSNFTNMNGYAITANDAALNMSSAGAGGYNNFVDVESCIELIDAKSIHLYQGHNNMGDYTAKCIFGTLNILCDDANCTMEIDAQQNYWGGYVNDGSLDLQSQGIFTPDMPDVAIEVYTAPSQGCNQNGWNGASMGCAVTFIDNEPEYNTACESVRPQVVISKRLNLEKPSGQAEKLTQTFLPHGQLKDALVDMGNPILNTATFTNVPLDSALVYAAWHMQMYDSLAYDSVAVALFHEILTSGLDRTNQGIRGRMEWGRYNMKTAMENLFYNNQLAQTNNTASFETPVQHYVDVLNTMTDTLLTASTYKEQFYLELDKGQLFRTLGNPLLARHIYRHLDDCDLDSVEQVQLNNWLAQVDLDISLNQQYIAQNTPPDSIVFAVDTTAYEAPIDYTTSNFYFGVWILSPSQVSFVNCGSNNVYRSMQQSSNDFDIYPNPTTGTFTMSVAQKANYTMSIVDLSGRVVHKCNMNLLENANATITLAPTIASGTYLAILEYDGGVLFNQLVVE